jgi:hypothetical protein
MFSSPFQLANNPQLESEFNGAFYCCSFGMIQHLFFNFILFDGDVDVDVMRNLSTEPTVNTK